MRYISTRGGTDSFAFADAVLMGLARDGGLLLPESYPDITEKLSVWRDLSYSDLAFEVMRLFATDIPDEDLARIISRSYAVFDHPEVVPQKIVGRLRILELWHGPTLAFKDIALQFLGNLFEYLLEKNGSELNILAATSGDTGSAAIHGVKGRARQRIFVLHPHGRVSPVQALQMTSVMDDNVFNLAVDGSFDDCQNIVKTLFRELEFRDRMHLGAMNSINWARVLAQVVYYFYAAFRSMSESGCERVSFSVPTGNFGDIFAGYVASQMGLPIDTLVLATNENDILSRVFESGEYRIGQLEQTLSPSMDIQIASNFERFLYHLSGNDASRLCEWMAEFETCGRLRLPDEALKAATGGGGAETVGPRWQSGACGTAETLEVIGRYHRDFGYVLDPHTAAGVAVGERHLVEGVPMVCLATAHPAKFPEAVERATGKVGLATHPAVEALSGRPQRMERMPAEVSAIRDFVAGHSGEKV